MKRNRAKRAIGMILVLAVVLLPTAAGADGGGGVFHGYQTGADPLPHDAAGLEYTGGFGYGISGHEVSGGFGVGWSDEAQPAVTGGGYGGVIYGWRDHAGPLNMLVTSWTGIGGIRSEGKGYLLLSEEVDLELGLALLPWFMPSVYVGYQVAGNLAPGRPFSEWLNYSPVAGFRIAFGNFR